MQHSSRKNNRDGFSGKKRAGAGSKGPERKSKTSRSGPSRKEEGDQPAWKRFSREERPRKHDSDERGDKRSGGSEKRERSFKTSKKEEGHYRPFERNSDRPKKKFDDKGPARKRSSSEKGSGDRKRFDKGGDRPKKRFDDERPRKKFSDDKGSGPKRFDHDDDRPKKRFDRDDDRPKKRFDDEGPRKKYSSEKGSDDRKHFDKDSDRPKKRFSDEEGSHKKTRSFDKKSESPRSFDRDNDRPKRRFGDDEDSHKKTRSFDSSDDRPKRRFSDDESSHKKTRSFDKKTESSRSFDRDDRPKKRFGDKKHGSSKAAPEKEFDGLTRLNKYLSNAGICSRREADELIKAGAVKVNGVVITEMGFKVKSTDVINYGGETLRNERKVYILLNKPKDYITTTDDPQERHTVMELIQGACKERVYPVGRLDRNTLGLLLFTNDGEMATKLMHPKFNVRKVYQVTLSHNIKPDDFKQLEEGVELEDGFIKPDEVSFITESKKEIGIEIHSGKNRIVRRIFEHLGYEVVKLDRVVYAGLTKKDLPRGKWRMLSPKEVSFLKMIG